MQGVVTQFDEAKGFGTIRAEDGAGDYFFHCTAIADGSRTIPVGTPVDFEVVAGHLGHYEAADVHKRPAQGS